MLGDKIDTYHLPGIAIAPVEKYEQAIRPLTYLAAEPRFFSLRTTRGFRSIVSLPESLDGFGARGGFSDDSDASRGLKPVISEVIKLRMWPDIQ